MNDSTPSPNDSVKRFRRIFRVNTTLGDFWKVLDTLAIELGSPNDAQALVSRDWQRRWAYGHLLLRRGEEGDPIEFECIETKEQGFLRVITTTDRDGPKLRYVLQELARVFPEIGLKGSEQPADDSEPAPALEAPQPDDQAGPPAVDEETERRLTAVRQWPEAKSKGVKRRDYVDRLGISESGLTRWRDELRSRGFDVPDF